MLVLAVSLVDATTVACSDFLGWAIVVITDDYLVLAVSAGRFEQFRSGAALSHSLGGFFLAIRARFFGNRFGRIVPLIHSLKII